MGEGIDSFESLINFLEKSDIKALCSAGRKPGGTIDYPNLTGAVIPISYEIQDRESRRPSVRQD